MHKQRLPFNSGPGGFGASAFNFNAPQFGDGGGFGHGPAPVSEGLNGMPFLGKTPTKPLMGSISRHRSLVEGAGLDSLPPPLLPTMAERILSGGVGRGGQRLGVPPIPNYFGCLEGDLSMLEEESPPDYLNQTKDPAGLSTIKDTDSESELRDHLDGATLLESRWRRVYGCLMDTLSPERRRRLEETLQRCGQTAIAKHLLVLLQLLTLVVGAGLRQVKRVGSLGGGVRFRVNRVQFQLRIALRQMLWRLANAKANDTLLFLIVVLVTPWLFLFSLLGFALSFVFSIRTAAAEGIRQLRWRLF
ncbi:uncharacterized protein LOC108146056 [Drosophila elegans]|uniref:uncharacterized protein LOC108146056 n=1 Tax=Drosophila elegans TaxID=30023 RepID=UPI001BC844A5|nr:uncharacterized protein LOC108146056 [Drosophila elegans]